MLLKEIELKGRRIVGGIGEGPALVTSEAISFFGGVDPESGNIIDKTHELYGRCITNKILVFPRGKGSTVGPYTIFALSKNRKNPCAMLNIETEPIIAAGCVLGNIPLMDRLSQNPLEIVEEGDHILVDADKGLVKVVKKEQGASSR